MIFDIVVIATLIISSAIAFFRGFIRETLTILGVGGGLVIAYILGPALQPLMRNILGVDPEGTPERLFNILPYSVLADGLAYGSVFIVFVILLSILSHYLSGSVRAVGLGALDRTLGVVFGILRAALILAILYLPLYILVEKDTREDWFEGSRTQIYVETSAGWLAGFIPQSVTEDADKKAEEAVKNLPSTARDKLKTLDLLGQNGESPDSEDQEPAGQTQPPATEDNGSGYQNRERRQMEDLIEDNLNE